MEVMTPVVARAGLLCVVVAAALAMVACAHSDGQRSDGGHNGQTGSYGTLTGRVARGPTSPISGPGIKARPAPPVAGAELKILDSKNAIVATARTDSDGRYRVALPPGNYRVERGAGFSGAVRNLPTMVAVSPRGQTQLDIWVDTGIRAAGRPAATR